MQAVNDYTDAQSRLSVRSSPQRKVPKFTYACLVTRGLEFGGTRRTVKGLHTVVFAAHSCWISGGLNFISDMMCVRKI